MFGREIRERRERICPEIAQNLFVCVCVQNEGFRGYLWTLACLLRLDAPCWCAKSSWRPYKVHWVNPVDVSKNFFFSCFSVLTSIAYLMAFFDSDWVDLDVLGKLWMSSFRTLKKLKRLWLDQKLWPWEVCWCAPHGFWDISILNFDFDPWAMVGKGIWHSLQWN